jgi:hypothetical protein
MGIEEDQRESRECRKSQTREERDRQKWGGGGRKQKRTVGEGYGTLIDRWEIEGQLVSRGRGRKPK